MWDRDSHQGAVSHSLTLCLLQHELGKCWSGPENAGTWLYSTKWELPKRDWFVFGHFNERIQQKDSPFSVQLDMSATDCSQTHILLVFSFCGIMQCSFLEGMYWSRERGSNLVLLVGVLICLRSCSMYVFLCCASSLLCSFIFWACPWWGSRLCWNHKSRNAQLKWNFKKSIIANKRWLSHLPLHLIIGNNDAQISSWISSGF